MSITSTAAYAKQLDKLVREIAGDTEDAIVLERARAVAQAELELARVRRAKVALIERASAFGEVDLPQLMLTRAGFMNLNDPLRRSDACCPNCASWTDTSAARLRSASERFVVFMVEEALETNL